MFGLSDAKNGSKWSGVVRLQPNARHIETAVTFWGQLPKSVIQSYHTLAGQLWILTLIRLNSINYYKIMLLSGQPLRPYCYVYILLIDDRFNYSFAFRTGAMACKSWGWCCKSSQINASPLGAFWVGRRAGKSWRLKIIDNHCALCTAISTKGHSF
jgi:hypothetical protein